MVHTQVSRSLRTHVTNFKAGAWIAGIWMLVLLLSSASVAEAQRQRGNANQGAEAKQGPPIAEIHIAVQDVNTREDIVILRPDDVLELNVGDKVRLRLVAIPQAQNHSPRYPAGTFSGPERRSSEVRLSDHKPHLGSVVLEARRLGDGESFFRYEVTDPLKMDRRMVKGTFGVRVLGGGANTGASSTGTNTYTGVDANAGNYATKVVNALYQGILMRAPDAGAQPRAQEIATKGHAAVVQHAREIATSRESQDVQGRVTHEQRLLSLYQHLMGLSQNEISEVAWRNDLKRLQAGQLEVVVINLTQSREFAERFGRSPQQRYQ